MDWNIYAQNYKNDQIAVFKERYGISPRNDKFYFYYDESDNIRKFQLKGDNSSFNADYLSQFTLGGLVSKNEITDTSLDFLYKQLNLQSNMKEIKSRHILNKKKKGISSFDSEKLSKFLKFLLDSEWYIHYTTVNVFYFGVVIDIIDSLIKYNVEKNNKYDINKADSLKSFLYLCMLAEIDNWKNVLSKINFPNLDDNGQQMFLYHLHRNVYSFQDENYKQERLIILEYIENNSKECELTFLISNKNHILIEDFTHYYLHKVFLYSDSYHIFDKENVIENKLEEMGIFNSEVSERFDFFESHKKRALQVSDICMGTISILYRFLAENSFEMIKEYFNVLDAHSYEAENLKLLAKFINKTIKYDSCFITQMSNQIELERYKYFIEKFVY